ncbi:MAG: DUF3854 domain-containing protein [Desertifilum sp.]|nr:DUF3854 domain-containing protein [Desertifilum sp.]
MLKPNHLQEWRDSAVDEAIAKLNVTSLEGDRVFELLCYSPDLERLNSGRLAAHLLNRYRLSDGGWWVSGVDPLTGEEMAWGQFKPNTPRLNEKGKPIKYEGPPKTQAELIFLRVPFRVGLAIALKAGLEDSYQRRVGSHSLDTEDKGFWQWAIASGCPVTITEGAKKAGALLSAGYAAIALPGIFMGQRVTERWQGQTVKRELHRLLKPFATLGRRVTFIFDNDPKPSTRKAVRLATILTGRLFAEAGCTVYSAGWHGSAKGIDDYIVTGGNIDEVVTGAKSLKQLSAGKTFELTYHSALQLNQRYLGALPFPQSGLVGVRSPKGTGKTYTLQKLAKECESQGRKILLLTHRIALGKAICEAIGIPYVSDRSSEAQEFKRLFGWGQCVDSLHAACAAQFNPQHWEGAVVIIDEVEQVIWHVLNSSTCKDKRIEILKNLRSLLQFVISTGGLIIVQDADLSDWSLDFIRAQLDFDITPWIVVNDYQATDNTCDVTFFDTQSDGVSKNDPSELLRSAAQEVNAGGKVFIALDSQKPKSIWGTRNVEQFLKRQCPQARIIRIDRETLGNPHHAAHGCEERINETVASYDIVICSPSLGTGVSIDIKGHFTGVYGIFQGAITANEARQALARVRECVPRYVWARSYAVGRIGNGETSAQEIVDSKSREIQQNLNLILRAEINFESNHNAIALKSWALMAARINSESYQYRDTLLEGLRSEGHRLMINGDSDDTTGKQMKAIRSLSWAQECAAVASARPIDTPEYLELQNKQTRTDEERYSERRYEVEQRYLIEATPELVKLDDCKVYSQFLLDYLLRFDTDGSLTKHRDTKRLNRHLENGGGTISAPDLRLGTAKVTALKKLGVLDFCDGREYCNESEKVQTFFEKCLTMRQDIKRYFGVGITPKTKPIGFINALLGLAGYRLIARKAQVEGKMKRFYKFDPVKSRIEVDEFPQFAQLREEVFGRWLTRDRASIAEAESEPKSIPFIQKAGDRSIEEINNPPPPQADEYRWLALKYLPLLVAEAEAEPAAREGLKSFINAFKENWREIASIASREIQIRLGALIEPAWIA